MDVPPSSQSGRSRASRLRRRLAQVTLRDVVIFTLPAFLLAGWLLVLPILDYARARQFDDWWSAQAHVHRFAWMRLKALLLLPKLQVHERRLDPADPWRGSLRLYVDHDAFARVSGDVLEHGHEWVDARIVRGNVGERTVAPGQPAEVRLRGDGSVHWTTAKKSLTVKTPKDRLWHGYRRLILSAKTVLPQYVAGSLAREMGLLAPRTEVLPVYLNDRYYGAFRFVEPVNESFLRRERLLPGNIFRADRAERGEYLKNLPRGVFKDPALWDRVAVNDRPGSIGARGLPLFLADLCGTTFAGHQRFLKWLDTEEVARLLALCLIVGDPYHMSAVHNQFWYEEPASGRMHPIVWDLRLLDLTERPEPLNPFWQSVLRDPRIQARALEIARAEIEERDVLGRGRELARVAYARCENELDYDRMRAPAISDVGSPPEVAAILAKNVATLRGWFADARAAFRADATEGGLVLDLQVDGRAGVLLQGFQIGPGAGASALSTPELTCDSNLSGHWEREEDRVLSGHVVASQGGARRFLLDEPLALLPAADTSGVGLAPGALSYRFFLATSGESEPPPAAPILQNRLTGGAVELTGLERGQALSAPSGSFHPWRYPLPARKSETAKGTLRLDRDLVIPAGSTWTLAPGTTVRLAPDVSILARGRILARGLPGAPIRFERADPGLPWGVLALQGEGSAGSRFEECTFAAGGGALKDRVEYKGMVAVHWTRDVVFRDCHFENNVRCDDAINVVQSHGIDILECTFTGANADSIDLDYSDGRIESCDILDSGNDGIDLMTSDPRISGCTIRNSRDKGISVGEGARPVVLATRIESCERGLEVKDGSAPWILYSEVSGCQVGLLAQVKNWRYGEGGRPRLIGSSLRGNVQDVRVGPHSHLAVLASRIGAQDVAVPPLLARDVEHLGRAHGAEVEWSASLESSGLEAGLPERWRAGQPLRRLAALEFQPDLAWPTAGWRFSGGVTRVSVPLHDLEVRARWEPGAIARPLDWDLGPPGKGDAFLVVEYASEALRSVRLCLPEGTRVELPPTGGGRSWRFAVVPLSGQRLTGIAFEIEPERSRTGAGFLGIHSIEAWRARGLEGLR